jgi:hypothetical protein
LTSSQILPDSLNAADASAMEAGIADHVWSLEASVALLSNGPFLMLRAVKYSIEI